MAETLRELSGLPLRVVDGGRMDFDGGLPPVAPRPRTLEEMRPVLYNQTATGPEELYFMYRGLGWPEDLPSFEAHSLRFDITVLRPGLVGGEYVKTAGHYHPPVPGDDPAARRDHSTAPGATADKDRVAATYPELYQVLAGRAHYLLQKPDGDRRADRLADVVVIEAGPGDALYVPPGYGHVTINPGADLLVMANVVDASFSSVYEPYLEKRGAAYYEVEEQGRGYFVANDRYRDPPKPRLGRPTDLRDLGLTRGEPLYTQLARDPGKFVFLSRPCPGGPIP